MSEQRSPNTMDESSEAGTGLSLQELCGVLLPRWKLILASGVVCGVAGLAISFAIPPTFTARATFLSPQPQQNSAAAALSNLGGGLSGLVGAAAGIRSVAEQYVTLMQSAKVTNALIEQFSLQQLYEVDFKEDARRELLTKTRIVAGKKDNIITIEVDDHDRQRAADMANTYIAELRKLANSLALTEAQQRRAFFEQHLTQTRDTLARAQATLQKSGVNPGALKSEPKAAAESYARVKAEAAATEVRLQALSSTMAAGSPEVQQQQALLAGLRAQLAKLESPSDKVGNEDYIGAYREFKYQETLFEIFSRQFELAKLDESREGTLFQIIDAATPPERKSKPKRLFVALGAFVAGLIAGGLIIVLRRRGSRPQRA